MQLNSSAVNTESAGGYLAIGALVNWAITSITQYDVFFHALASIATTAAAGLSIYFTLRARHKRSDP